jgi:hypothetical protein
MKPIEMLVEFLTSALSAVRDKSIKQRLLLVSLCRVILGVPLHTNYPATVSMLNGFDHAIWGLTNHL